MKQWIGLALLVLVMPAQAQVYKCEAGGKTVFQGTPCGNSLDPAQIPSLSTYSAPEIVPPAPRPERLQQRAPRQSQQGGGMSNFEWRNELVKARSRGIILMGMELDDVTHILGRPDDVDTTTTSSGTCQRLTWFKNHRVDHYIRMCDGKVEYHSR